MEKHSPVTRERGRVLEGLCDHPCSSVEFWNIWRLWPLSWTPERIRARRTQYTRVSREKGLWLCRWVLRLHPPEKAGRQSCQILRQLKPAILQAWPVILTIMAAMWLCLEQSKANPKGSVIVRDKIRLLGPIFKCK